MISNGRYLINGDAAAIPLAPRSVHCIATSPPYWSLRRYPGSQDRPWPAGEYSPMPGVPPIPVDAWTGPLGLEPTPELFIWHLVLVFRECRRVLRDDGVMWVVIGDSYASSPPGNKDLTARWNDWATGGKKSTEGVVRRSTISSGLQPGDLVGIPARLQFALQADGWVIRNDVVWHKSNPMPESVAGQRWERCRTKVKPGRPPALQEHLPDNGQRPGGNRGNQWGDVQNQPNATWQPCPGCAKCEEHGGYVLRRGSWRHTRAHEVVLMCVKGMGYWSDQEVVREAHWHQRKEYKQKYAAQIAQHHRRPETLEGNGQKASVKFKGTYDDDRLKESPAGRNPRSVVTPKPESYSGAHYAAYPTSLIAPLIRATCPARCCPVCGVGWSPVVERETGGAPNEVKGYQAGVNSVSPNITHGQGSPNAVMFDNSMQLAPRGGVKSSVLGYRPSCDCGREDWQPGIVMDCFCGSGTTIEVAKDLMLRAVGIDLSHSYLDEQAKVRGKIGAPSSALENLPLFHPDALSGAQHES